MDSGKDITFLFNVEICQCRTTCNIKRNFVLDYSPSGSGNSLLRNMCLKKCFSWNYLEYAIPRFLSKYFWGEIGYKNSVSLVKEIKKQ